MKRFRLRNLTMLLAVALMLIWAAVAFARPPSTSNIAASHSKAPPGVTITANSMLQDQIGTMLTTNEITASLVAPTNQPTTTKSVTTTNFAGAKISSILITHDALPPGTAATTSNFKANTTTSAAPTKMANDTSPPASLTPGTMKADNAAENGSPPVTATTNNFARSANTLLQAGNINASYGGMADAGKIVSSSVSNTFSGNRSAVALTVARYNQLE